MATTTEPLELSPVIGGRQTGSGDTYEVRSPYDEELVAVVHRAGPKEIDDALARAAKAFETTRKLPSWRRGEILESISRQIFERRDEFARTIALEAGKPVKTARLEAERAAFVFKVAAEEAKRIYGEIVPLDWIPGNDNRVAHVRRVSQTPISSFKLAEIVLEAGWPEDGIAVVPSTTKDAAALVEDPRVKLLTFTGSPAVGWGLKGRAGMKRVTLELGGNAAVIVHADADTEYAAERIVWGGTTNAGQTCISVQRVYHHESLDGFQDELVRRFEALVVGDPLDEATDVGPLI